MSNQDPTQFQIDELEQAVTDAREAYAEFVEKWQFVGRLVRGTGPYGRFLDNRVEAYPSWDGSRDVGNGQSFPEWFDEVELFVEGLPRPEGEEATREDQLREKHYEAGHNGLFSRCELSGCGTWAL